MAIRIIEWSHADGMEDAIRLSMLNVPARFSPIMMPRDASIARVRIKAGSVLLMGGAAGAKPKPTVTVECLTVDADVRTAIRDAFTDTPYLPSVFSPQAEFYDIYLMITRLEPRIAATLLHLEVGSYREGKEVTGVLPVQMLMQFTPGFAEAHESESFAINPSGLTPTPPMRSLTLNLLRGADNMHRGEPFLDQLHNVMDILHRFTSIPDPFSDEIQNAHIMLLATGDNSALQFLSWDTPHYLKPYLMSDEDKASVGAEMERIIEAAKAHPVTDEQDSEEE